MFYSLNFSKLVILGNITSKKNEIKSKIKQKMKKGTRKHYLFTEKKDQSF